jgi:hypothetical protein
MKNTIKKLLSSRMYRAGACLLLAIIFEASSNITSLEFMSTVALVPTAYVVWIVLVFMAHAWIINPIKSLKERRKGK